MYTGLDLETHLIQPGLLCPPIVCGSFAGKMWAHLTTPFLEGKRRTMQIAEQLLRGSTILCGANIAYDFGCLCAEDPSLIPLVFAKYQRGEVHDVLIAASLDFIARGLMQDGEIWDPRTAYEHIDEESGRRSVRYQQIRTVEGRISNRFTLEIVTDLYLGRKDAKANDIWRLSYALLEDKPIKEWPPEAVQYPLDDAQNSLEVAEYQAEVCENLHDLPTQCFAAWCMHLGALWGFRTDGGTLDSLEKELLGKIEKLKEHFSQFGIYRQEKKKGVLCWVQTKSVVKEMVTKAYLGKPPMTDPTESNPLGNVSCERTVLEDSGDEILEELAQVSKLDKLYGYLPALRQGALTPINVSPNPVLATGRSSYEGFVQLMPRKGGIRERCIARLSTLWSSVDYAALEAHTLGQVLYWVVGRSKMADMLNADLDPHAAFAGQMVGKSYEEILALLALKDAYVKDVRQATKAGNYGFPGGMSAPKFVLAKRKDPGMRICLTMHTAEKCGVTKLDRWNNHAITPTCKQCVLDSENLRINWLELFDEMPDYFEWIKKTLRENDNMLEQFVSKRIRGGLRFTSGANTMFQGLAADGAKRAVIRMTEEMYLDTQSPLYGSRLIIFSHDETILEIPEDRDGLVGTPTDAGKRQALIQVEEMSKVCPDMKKIKAEPAFMRRWYKDAEPVWVDGQLVPWEPKAKAA
jgi:DNA polymerase-1